MRSHIRDCGAEAERKQNRSTTNRSNTQFSASTSKPRAPNHLCPQEMTDPPASAPRMCEHTRGGGAGMSKSVRLRSATAPRMCEHSFTLLITLLHWQEQNISMAYCKTAVTPLLMHWSYCNLAVLPSICPSYFTKIYLLYHWNICAMNWVISGLGNRLVQCQAITWHSVNLL